MPEAILTLTSGRSLTLPVPEPGTGRSVFLLSLPKAGSTLFYRIMKPVCERAGLSYYSLPNELNALGVAQGEVSDGFQKIFAPTGYAFGGFRGFGHHLTLPDYAADATVLLVRDPRDMLTSLYFSEAKSHVPPGATASNALLEEFEKRRKLAQETAIDAFVLQRSAGVIGAYRGIFDAIGDKGHRLFRYEDVIFDKARWIGEVVEYLKLDVPRRRIEAVVARNDIVPVRENQDEHIRKVTPGDHRDKLKPETIAELDEKLAPILSRLGYAEAADVPADAASPQ